MVLGRHASVVFGTIAGFVFGIVFGTLIVLHYGRQSFHFAQSVSKATDTVAHIDHGHPTYPTCVKFIMFTTQRSGSDWLTDALSHQPEVWCEGELLMGFVDRPEALVSANWVDEVDRGLDKVCKEAQSRGKSIAGFKIMYNEVLGERHKVNGVDLPREWFKDSLQRRNVRILHLVREAQILTMASLAQAGQDRQEFNLSFRDTFHTTDPNIVAKTMNSRKIVFGQGHLPWLRKKESEILEWSTFLRRLGLPYHSVRYEDLTSKNQDEFVYMMLHFLGIKDTVSYPKFKSQLQLRHKPRCEDRIAHFEDQVKPLIQGTMSERACALLEYSDFAQSVSKANDIVAHFEHGNPNCTKFIVLTTQRSGSGWLCEGLSHQPEVWCAGEILWTFSHQPEAEVSANWMAEIDRSFGWVCKDARSRGKSIAGFKIMYDQVRGERHEVNGVDLPGEWFKDFLQKRNVQILHLVREAAILSLVSMTQTQKNIKEVHGDYHTKDPDVAAAMMNSTQIPFGQWDLQRLRKKENEISEWLAFLSQMGVPYHYVRYEDLTSKNQDVFFRMMLQFLGIKDKVSPKFQSEFYLSHKVRCEDRIAHFQDQVKPLIQGTMSERACAVLEYSNLA